MTTLKLLYVTLVAGVAATALYLSIRTHSIARGCVKHARSVVDTLPPMPLP